MVKQRKFQNLKKLTDTIFADHHRSASKIESGQTNVPGIGTITICFAHYSVLEATNINGHNKE